MTTLPKVLTRDLHGVSRSNISSNALKVLYRLHEAGYRACLVGGGVRDVLLNVKPKDFDIATDAHPEEVVKLFSNSRLIGRRFRLAHVHYGRDIIEVATFRTSPTNQRDRRFDQIDGRIVRDNVYGTIEDDAWRRDFTINALYYDIDGFNVLDYVGGLDDLDNQVIRLIGHPLTRYQEDPVRILRAIRFAAKLGFTIDADTLAPIQDLAYRLHDVPAARLLEEGVKLFHGGYAVRSYEVLLEHDLFRYLFPATASLLDNDTYATHDFLLQAFKNTDERIQQGKPVNPAYLLAVLMWYPVLRGLQHDTTQGSPSAMAIHKAADNVLGKQNRITAMPRRYTAVMRSIWTLQTRLETAGGSRAQRLITNPRFRAAYDFLCMRQSVGEQVFDRHDLWTDVQDLPEPQQDHFFENVPKITPGHQQKSRSKSRRRRRKKTDKTALQS